MESEVTILIIDDIAANIFALERMLEKPGRSILSTTHGKEGLKIALEKDVDLIILDVQMPEMDGFEVAQVLKSHRRTSDIPIIFATAEKKERHSIMKGFEEGAVDYLSKPLDPELTRAKVTVLLKTQFQKKELVKKNLSLEKAEAEIKRLNVDLQQNLVRLEVANKELESFSYSVSHDLRAPLRSVIGFSEILKEECSDKLNDDNKRALNSIIKNAGRMNKLIDDLLEFSKFGKVEMQKSQIDTEKLVRSIIEEVSESIHHRAKITLNTLLPSYADHSLLIQVWSNLISNALKYSAKRKAPQVEIGSSMEGNEITYYIKDNGAGFDMHYIDKLFGVFQRLHKAEEFEGTGVGLALVQQIISRHGGHVWAEGKVNKGASFFFSLPVNQI